MSAGVQLRAVAFKEGDVWVVQGIEYDVVAQVKDPFDAPAAFIHILASTMLINKKLGRDALACIKAAPEKFRDMYDNATMELKPLGPMPGDWDMPRPDISLRGYSRHAA